MSEAYGYPNPTTGINWWSHPDSNRDFFRAREVYCQLYYGPVYCRSYSRGSVLCLHLSQYFYWSPVKGNCSNLALITCSTTLGLFRITATMWSITGNALPSAAVQARTSSINSGIVIVVLHVRFRHGKR